MTGQENARVKWDMPQNAVRPSCLLSMIVCDESVGLFFHLFRYVDEAALFQAFASNDNFQEYRKLIFY